MGHGIDDARIHELAARQHGVIARAQLLGAGVSADAIAHRLHKGTLRRVHRGVYRTGPIAGPYQQEMAATLACGPRSAVSDRTAGGLWGLLPPRRRGAAIDVTGPRTLRGPASGVRLHRRGPLGRDETTRRHGLPLTTPARTILDVAHSLGPYPTERVLARALKRSLATRGEIKDLILRHPHRRGCRLLRTLLADAAGPALTRSEAEALFLALLRKGGVARPRVNAVVHGLEVDFFWPDRGVVVEVDGFAFHAQRNAFEDDRQRDARLAAENLVVIRFTWRQIQVEPEKALARLCMTLGARSRRPTDRLGTRSAR